MDLFWRAETEQGQEGHRVTTMRPQRVGVSGVVEGPAEGLRLVWDRHSGGWRLYADRELKTTVCRGNTVDGQPIPTVAEAMERRRSWRTVGVETTLPVRCSTHRDEAREIFVYFCYGGIITTRPRVGLQILAVVEFESDAERAYFSGRNIDRWWGDDKYVTSPAMQDILQRILDQWSPDIDEQRGWRFSASQVSYEFEYDRTADKWILA